MIFKKFITSLKWLWTNSNDSLYPWKIRFSWCDYFCAPKCARASNANKYSLLIQNSEFKNVKMAFCGFAFFSDFSFLLKKRERSKKRVKLFAFGKRLCKLSFLDKSGENSKLKREKTQNYLAFRRCSRLLKVRLFRSYKKLRFFNLQKKKKQMVITPKLKTQAYDTE